MRLGAIGAVALGLVAGSYGVASAASSGLPDADEHAAYEVHMVKSDGTPATVYVDKQFDVVNAETGMPAPPQQPQA